MDAAEGVVETKRSACEYGPRRRCYRTASPEPIVVIKGDEHVFAFDTPVRGECPFDAAADRPGGGGILARSRDQPVAATGDSVLARVEDRRLGRDESDAALDVKQRTIPGISHS